MNPVVQFAPRLDEAEATRLARTLYGVEVSARPLPSERDQNFYLKDTASGEFVLKIANATETLEILDFQNKAMEHLAAHSSALAVPSVRKTLQGESIARVVGADGQTHFVRLLSYLPGRVLAASRPHNDDLLQSLGRQVAEMDRAFRGFSHPAMHRDFPWDLKSALWIRKQLPRFSDSRKRSIVERFLDRFEEKVLPRKSALASAVIHNDWNDYNVLVSLPGDGERRVIGAVDFGDMVHSFVIGDLAVAATYVMLDKPDPIAAAAAAVTGYHQALPLNEIELSVLYELICARLCLSVTMSACQHEAAPDNEYLRISERQAWALLHQLSQIDPHWPHYVFRDACGFPANPDSAAVTQWLREQGPHAAGVTDYDLKTGPVGIIDLSVDSGDIPDPEVVADLNRFVKWTNARLAEARAPVGVGGYGEVRLVYSSDQFKRPSNDGFESRTVHLGIDLSLSAGSALYAPLDGVVHSFRNNALPLDYGPTVILEHTAGAGGKRFYSLFGHLSVDSLGGLYVGKPIRRGERIARVGDPTVNGGWPPHLHFQLITDLLGRKGDCPGVATPRERSVWLNLCPDPNLLLGVPGLSHPPLKLSGTEIAGKRRQHLGGNLSLSYKKPLTIVRGRDQYLFDDDARRYLDAVNNVPHVGHGHPRVVRAAAEQMAVLNTNTRYLHENIVRYAERLTALLPESLDVCYFVNSGSEANELALRLARAYSSNTDVVVLDHAYHGNTGAMVEISPYKFDGPGGSGAPPHVHKAPMPDLYRGPFRTGQSDAGSRYAETVIESLHQILEAGRKPAAFFCESVLGCGGQVVLPDGYLKLVYPAVRAAGAVCVADEVQVGLGRVGSCWWGFETQGVVPDIVTLGKPIGNGFPLGAVVTRREIAEAFDNGMEFFSTFGGNPVACAVGLAVLDVMRDENLREHARTVGDYLKRGLDELAGRFSIIGDVRGLGLFLGVEMVLDRVTIEPAAAQADYIANRMKERGILISTEGPLHNVLKIKPPLVFNRADADFFIETLAEILDEDFAKP